MDNSRLSIKKWYEENKAKISQTNFITTHTDDISGDYYPDTRKEQILYSLKLFKETVNIIINDGKILNYLPLLYIPFDYNEIGIVIDVPSRNEVLETPYNEPTSIYICDRDISKYLVNIERYKCSIEFFDDLSFNNMYVYKYYNSSQGWAIPGFADYYIRSINLEVYPNELILRKNSMLSPDTK